MKVLLINPPDDLSQFLGNGKQFIPVLEPLGLLSIAASLRASGCEVSVLDAYASNLGVDKVKEYVSTAGCDVVGITSFISNGEVVFELGRWIKLNLPSVFVVLGNMHAAVYAEGYLRSGCCDCVIHGEGEEVFVALVRALESGSGLYDIPYLACLRGEQYTAARKWAVVRDLSSLSLPARDLVDATLYNFPSMTNMPYSHRLGRVAKHMYTSRGCPFHCSFCAVNKEGGRRCHSLGQVEEEMRLLYQDYGAQYIFFMDPIFAYEKQRVVQICRMIRRSKMRLRWGCEGHINSVDEQMIEEMEAAGCHDIAFGIESGVQRLLNVVRKGTRLEDIERQILLIKKKSRMGVAGLFILGLPGETEKDSRATIEFAKRLPLDMAQFSIFVPYPGSPLFYELAARGEIDTGERPGGRLDPSIWRRYSSYISFTGNHPIWVTPGLTADALKALQRKAIRDFYLRPAQFLYQLKRLSWKEAGMALSAFKTVVGAK